MRLTRSAPAAALAAVVMLLAACGTETEAPSDAAEAEPSNAAARPSPSTSPKPTGPVADPEHAVEAPGPREGTIVGDDMLVVAPDGALSDETVEAISGLQGVAAAEVISVQQVSIENEVYNVAAVDPGEYRRFTASASAELQEQWDRVAGGELSVAPELRKKLPLDKDGYLEVGSGAETEKVHVGAYAPQVGTIDAVVNEKWGEALGMTPGNAVVLATGKASPQSLRKPIENLLDETASIQDLDIVAEEGLDTSATQSAVFVGSFADAVGTFNYTVIGGGRIAPEPAWVSSHIMTGDVPILGTITCNKAIFPQLEAALQEISLRGLADEINPDEYAGCYYPRFIAGSTSLSNHSFGLALDLNVPGNQRGTVGEMDRGVVDAFKKWGFAWGGDWNYTDPMHFELDRIVNPS